MTADPSRRARAAVLALGYVIALAACAESPLAEDPAAYVGELRTLNTRVTGRIEGTVTFTVEDGVLTAKVKASGFDPVVHPQYVHEKGKCPSDDDDDDNRDDHLDVVEGRARFGRILVPLDSRLADLRPGPEGGDFPRGEVIDYAQVVDVDDFVGALRAFESPDTMRVGLRDEAKLKLETRTVVVYGVVDDLPSTVRSAEELPASSTLPVACAVIRRLQ